MHVHASISWWVQNLWLTQRGFLNLHNISQSRNLIHQGSMWKWFQSASVETNNALVMINLYDSLSVLSLTTFAYITFSSSHFQNTSLPRIFKLFRGLGLRHLVVINKHNEVSWSFFKVIWSVHGTSPATPWRIIYIWKCPSIHAPSMSAVPK